MKKEPTLGRPLCISGFYEELSRMARFNRQLPLERGVRIDPVATLTHSPPKRAVLRPTASFFTVMEVVLASARFSRVLLQFPLGPPALTSAGGLSFKERSPASDFGREGRASNRDLTA